jgi:hypothetical protein
MEIQFRRSCSWDRFVVDWNSMKHFSRALIVFTVLSLAVYITGLQEDAVSPIFDWYGDLAAVIQLLFLIAIAAGVGLFLADRRRRRLSQLRAASDTVEQFLQH